MFGCWTSASRKTVEPIFERHDGLLVYPVQYEGLEESPNVVYLGATPNQQIVPAVRWAFAFLGKRRFFLVGSDYVFPRAANAIIRDTLAELNAEVVGEDYLPLGSYDVKPVVEQDRRQPGRRDPQHDQRQHQPAVLQRAARGRHHARADPHDLVQHWRAGIAADERRPK